MLFNLFSPLIAQLLLGTEVVCWVEYYGLCSHSSWALFLCTGCAQAGNEKKEEHGEWEMEGWSERWVIFSVRRCCFPLNPVIFAHKWLPGSGWKKSIFFCFHIWCNFMMGQTVVFTWNIFLWTYSNVPFTLHEPKHVKRS